MAQWYYTQNGQQAGPVDEGQLKSMIAAGQVAASEMVWKDGMANWQTVSSVAELGGSAPAAFPQQPYPQQPYPQQPYPQQPQNFAVGSVPNYLVQSILVTIFCCWPVGIAAIVFAAQVNGKLQRGDYAGAVDSSKKAKMFCWICFGLGLCVYAIYLLIAIAGGLSRNY